MTPGDEVDAANRGPGRLDPSIPAVREAVRRRLPADSGAAVEDHPLAVLLILATAAQALATWRIVRRLSPGTRPGLRDSIIFEYVGFRLARGARLYVDLWEVKPPLAFELPALLALLTGDVLVYHWLLVFVTNAALVGSVLLVGAIVRDLADDGRASIVAGLALLVHPVVGWRAPIGFKPKYLVVAFGLLCVLLALRDRPVLSGIAAAAAVGVWQFGLVFPLLGAGLVFERRGRDGLARFVAAGLAAGALILLPVALQGALDAMVVETLLVPLLVGSQRPLPARVEYAVRLLDLAIPVAIVASYGIGSALRPRWRREAWWVAAGAAWFALVIVLFDFDGPGDLIPILAFLALGVGLAYAERRDTAILVLVVGMAALSVATVGEFGYFARLPIPGAHAVPTEMAVSPPYDAAERRFLYWRAREPGTCRVFLGVTQARLLGLIEGSVEQATCGHWAPVREALEARYGLLRLLPG